MIVLLRGDNQLEEAKLGGVLGTATFRTAGDAEIVKVLGAKPGSLGAVGIEGIPVGEFFRQLHPQLFVSAGYAPVPAVDPPASPAMSRASRLACRLG